MAEVVDDNSKAEPRGADSSRWSQVWQMPVLVLGVAAFGLGVYLSIPQPEENQFDEVLQETVLYLKARNLDQAQAMLSDQLEPYIAQATFDQQAMYYLTWGDLVFLQQEINRWDKPENHYKTLRYYEKARELGLQLDATHLQRMAETLVALKRDKDAIAVLDQLKDAPARRRYQVIRKIIDRRRKSGATAHGMASLVARFDEELHQETDPKVRREQEMWSTRMQAQGLLGVGDVEKAIEYLQRRMIQFMAAGGDRDLAPLRVLLAKAFQHLDEHEEAQRWYRLAQQKMASTDPLNADVLVGLAQIELAQTGDVRAALENFSVAESEYPTAPAYIDALIGRADCEARLGEHTEAIEHFGLAVKIVIEDLKWSPDQINRLAGPIYGHFDLNGGRQEFSLALDYLELLKKLYPKQIPPRLLQELAVTHEQIAKQRLAAFASTQQGATDDLAGRVPDGIDFFDSDARRLAMQKAAVHYGKAGEFYLQHAHAVTGVDNEGFGRSLWSAAVDFDKAQLWEKAIQVYTEFIETRPSEDPHQLEAVRHLGLAYQSAGQFPVAIEMFQRLVEEHKHTPEAYKSLVPLASCFMATEQFDAAERVLLYAVTDHPAITPDSLHYRQALVELGKLYYQTRRFEPAIARLTEAVDRYGQTREGPSLRFRLADAYRLSVPEMDRSFKEAAPQKKQAHLQTERARRLEQAQVLFGQVISETEAIETSARSALEGLYLRNAYFYRADCAYDMGRYEQAISLYDLAAKRWEAHPASLVALVQIVNAYCELGRTQEAKVANDRARWQLKRIPDEAFDDPTLPMTRVHWQQWLRWTSELDLFASQASVTGTLPKP